MQDSNAALRKTIYALLIAASCGTMIGRLWSVQSPLGESPLLSANDRSRWSTVRALVDQGTFALDGVIFEDPQQTRRAREWYSIDMVRHKGHDGVEHYYSSKPPLLATLVAGKYWLLKRLSGMTLGEHPFYVVRVLLVTTNIVPLLCYFLVLASLVERYGTTDWGRLYVMICAAFGTLLTAFAVTLNNHVISAVSVAVATWAALRIWRERELTWTSFFVCGFFAAFAVANDLPALSLCGLLGIALLWRSPLRTLLGYVPAAAVVAVAFFATNYLAHGSWRPPYAHRADGPLLATITDVDPQQLKSGPVAEPLLRGLAAAGLPVSDTATIQRRPPPGHWMLWDPVQQQRLALVPHATGLRIHQWDNWYEYGRSYWVQGQKAGVDLGEPSRLRYAMHLLVGHHGMFSLTPIWLLSAAGLGYWLTRSQRQMRGYAVLVVALSAVCLTFYILRPLGDRNYGGVSNGFRWMFWFTPLYLIAMLPAADWLGRTRAWRTVGAALLLFSAISASYTPLNPWSHPWLYKYLTYIKWLQP